MRQGLTLIEVLVVLGITTVVGALLLAVIVNSAGLFYKESSKVEQGLGINDALSKVEESIKQSSSVAASFQDGSTTYTSGSTQLVLKVPSTEVSGNIISDVFDYFVFVKDQSNLRFKVFPDSSSKRKSVNQVFSSNLNNLLFQYYNSAIPPQEVSPILATKVKITLTLKQKAGAAYEQNTATGEANLRND